MSWLTDWRALASRIQGLINAGTFFFMAQHHSSEDASSVKKKVLLKSAKNIFNELAKFLSDYNTILPTNASQSLERFLNDPDIKGLDFTPSQSGMISANVQFALTSLSAFCSEFTYLLADTQAIARRITERAFIHLQRTLMVDSEIQRKWKQAFEESTEPACEKLGAIHLLSHGIWAFKADAIRGQTDLVLNEPLPSLSIIENSADALVLTEWKLVKEEKELTNKIKAAKKQTENYSKGVLGGIELANYRYLIMVSVKTMKMPDNLIDGIVTYRHINIAVNPAIPSVEAKESK